MLPCHCSDLCLPGAAEQEQQECCEEQLLIVSLIAISGDICTCAHTDKAGLNKHPLSL